MLNLLRAGNLQMSSLKSQVLSDGTDGVSGKFNILGEGERVKGRSTSPLTFELKEINDAMD